MASAFIIKGDDGLEYGPVELAELREWVREKRAGLGTRVRQDEPEAIWQPWQHYPELVALLAESQARDTVAVAPLSRRLIGFLIDLFLINILFVLIFYGILLPLYPAIFAPWFAASQAMLASGQLASFHPPAPAESLLELLTVTLFLLYFAGYHFAHGRTPGKSIVRLRVVDRHGEKPTVSRALVRALVLCLSGYLFVPLLFIFLHPQRRALHDLAAGTYVVEL
jgi:uncharacterized RDD family membrane protein YckC